MSVTFIGVVDLYVFDGGVTERCQSWSPGCEHKCIKKSGHGGRHFARRLKTSVMAPGARMLWGELE